MWYFQIKSEDVVRKYITRCCQVNPIINAIVDTRYEIAIAEAKNVDVLISSGCHSEEELENSYPLLGVPITIKESIAVKGHINIKWFEFLISFEPK